MILLDLDGVIVDFVGAALRLHGRDVNRALAEWPAGEWDICKAMGVSPKQFWKKVDEAGEDWWATLPLYPWAVRMLLMVRNRGDFIVATSPSRSHTSSSGKIRWLQEKLGVTFRAYMLGEHKHLMAGPDRILIDDNERACQRFEEAGGKSVLFPAVWNSLGAKADPVEYVVDRLAMLGAV